MRRTRESGKSRKMPQAMHRAKMNKATAASGLMMIARAILTHSF